MFVFYRGPRALITTDVFEVRGLTARRFTVGDLRYIRVVRRRPRDAGADQPTLGVSALLAAVLVIPLVGPASRVLAGVLVVALLSQAAFCLWPRRVRWELVAVYQGRPVVVFNSMSQREFDQVCRGLRRCLEHRKHSH